jgi:methylated-DNA-[protein]-cysteine S-methyltransferase
MKPLYMNRIETPVGAIHLLATDRGMCSVHFEKARSKTMGQVPGGPSRRVLTQGGTLLRRAERQILEYLEERRRAFVLALDLRGFSPFERSVLKTVRGIPFGESHTYAQVALLSGNPRAARQVRDFLVVNPIPILIPCHRVIGAAGLGDYVGGRALKTRLIDMERGQMLIGFGAKPMSRE